MLCYYYFSVRSKADTSQLNLLHGKQLQALAVKTASEMTYIVSSGALNSSPTNQPTNQQLVENSSAEAWSSAKRNARTQRLRVI